MAKPNLEAKANWGPIREAFLQESPTPNYKELGERFGISEQLVGRMAREENWPEQRLKLQNTQLQAINAGEVIAQAITAEKLAVDQAKQVAIRLLSVVENTLLQLETLTTDVKNARKVMDMANTAAFAFNNVSNGLKNLGIVGLPKQLSEIGKENNGRWDPKLLNQINVTIQGLTQPAKVSNVDRSVTTANEQPIKEGGSEAVDVQATATTEQATQ